MSHSSDDSGNSVPDLTMQPPQWVIDKAKAEQEKQEKQEKLDEDEVSSDKLIKIYLHSLDETGRMGAL